MIMFKLLERYIAKTVILATAMTALIVSAVLFLVLLLGEMKNVGEGEYGLTQAISFVLLRLPNEFYAFSPMLMLLGSISALSMLSASRELAVMRASGFAIRRIIYSVMGAALVLILIVSLLGEWMAPTLSSRATMQKEIAQNSGQAVMTARGAWLHINNNFIHIQYMFGPEKLVGVTRYTFDDQHRLQAAYFAKSLTLENNDWWMNNVVKTTFYRDRTRSEAFPKVLWDLKFNANLLKVGMVQPEEMTLPKLNQFIRYLQHNGLQASGYKYEFWQRVFQPFASLIMIFLAVPFVLGAFRTSALGWQIIVGILAGFVFYISNALLGQLSIVYQIPPVFAALLPLLFFALLGIIMAKRLITR
jgi:lipopolysaccharide export system permease protein